MSIVKIKRGKRKVRSIQWELLSKFFILLVALLIGLTLYQTYSMKRYLYKSQADDLNERFRSIDRDIVINTKNDSKFGDKAKFFFDKISNEDVNVIVLDAEGNEILLDRKSPKMIDNKMKIPYLSKDKYVEILNNRDWSEPYSIIKDDDGREQLVIFRKVGEKGSPAGLVQISTYIKNADNIIIEQLKILCVSTLFILIIGGFLGRTIFNHTLKPLKKVADTMENIDTNKLDSRLEEDSNQIEINKLATSINIMLNKLEESFNNEKITNEKMRDFILDASHELRTPLTSIQGFIEVLQLGAFKDEDKLKLALDSMLKESHRLAKLVNNLLLLTKLEGSIMIESKEENISNIIMEIENQLNILGGDRSLNYYLHENANCIINRDELKQIIFNLVQNSINYTDAIKGEITILTDIEYREKIEYIRLQVNDNGEGISNEKLQHIFDRFYRGEEDRSRKKGGYGLGLSIVKSIVDKYEGKIEVESKIGEGTIFSIYFKSSRKSK